MEHSNGTLCFRTHALPSAEPPSSLCPLMRLQPKYRTRLAPGLAGRFPAPKYGAGIYYFSSDTFQARKQGCAVEELQTAQDLARICTSSLGFEEERAVFGWYHLLS